MIAPFRPGGLKERRREAVGVVSCLLVVGTTGFAQTDDVFPSRSRIRHALERPAPAIDFVPAGTSLLPLAPRALETPAERFPPQDITLSSQPRRPSRAPRRRAKVEALKAVGAVVGLMGGFYLGGKLGAAIEGDGCRCDDPGLRGFLLGAGIGAVGGTILGVHVASR